MRNRGTVARPILFLLQEVFIDSPDLNLTLVIFDQSRTLILKVQTREERLELSVLVDSGLACKLRAIVQSNVEVLLLGPVVVLEVLLRLVHLHAQADVGCAYVTVQDLVAHVSTGA